MCICLNSGENLQTSYFFTHLPGKKRIKNVRPLAVHLWGTFVGPLGPPWISVRAFGHTFIIVFLINYEKYSVCWNQCFHTHRNIEYQCYLNQSAHLSPCANNLCTRHFLIRTNFDKWSGQVGSNIWLNVHRTNCQYSVALRIGRYDSP